MMHLRAEHESAQPPRVVLNLRPGTGWAELEFLALFSEENLKDRIDYLGDDGEQSDVSDLSFRLLRHYATAVRHRKYYGLDVVTVEVEGSAA